MGTIFEWQTKYFDERTEREINNCRMWERVCVCMPSPHCGHMRVYNNVIFTLYLCKYAFRVFKSDICKAIHPNICKRNDTITKLLSYPLSPPLSFCVHVLPNANECILYQ